jgi:acetyl-CoA C-acetyltransferase
MVKDGLWDVFNDYHMGITAEMFRKNMVFPGKSKTASRSPPSKKAAKAQKGTA